MIDWQDIETAPKDRLVLLCNNTDIHAGYWAQHEVTKEEAWIVGGLTNGELFLFENPTHWMPLPAPPNVK